MTQKINHSLSFFLESFIMSFFLSIACGVATYQFLLHVMGAHADLAEAIGWVVGLGFLCFCDALVKYLSNLGSHKRLKLRIKELELQLHAKEQQEAHKQQVEKKMNFFERDM